MRSLMHNTSSFQGRNYTSYQKKFDFSLTWVVRNEFTRLLIHNLRFSVCLLYPCKQKGGGGYIGITMSVHPSLLLSVCKTYFLGKFYRSRRYVSQTKFFRNLLILTKKNKRSSYKISIECVKFAEFSFAVIYIQYIFFSSLKFMWYTICNMLHELEYWTKVFGTWKSKLNC